MAGIDLNQAILLHGIGKGYFETVDGKFLEILSGQTLKLDVAATMEDVYGGDSLFPRYTYISKKEGTIEVDVCDFSLSQVTVGQTVDLDSSTAKRLQRVIKKATTDTSLGTSLTGVTDVKCMTSDGTPVVVVAATPGASQVAVSATGEITWGTGITTGEYIFWFKSDSANATKAMLLKNAMPSVAEFSWAFTTEDKEGNKYQVDIYAKRVRGDGKFTIDTARDKASSPKITVKILDPGDGTDEFCSITISKLA
ncbi:hypothetical protein [Sporomusa aerivorans]|uniref:hypothetical protein n=1 Tax=Sporomusa aerivorans TaxID=204936 RepID=UPI00352BC991